MRICLIVSHSEHKVSGGYIYDLQLAERLRRFGHEVEVIPLQWKGLLRDVPRNWSATFRRRLSGPFDLMLQDKSHYASLFHLNRHLDGCPRVAIVHHLSINEPRWQWKTPLIHALDKRYLATVDAYVFNTPETQRQVEALVGNGRPSVVAYPAGTRFGEDLDIDAIAVRAAEPGPLRLLFVGNVTPRKGLPHLLNAMATLPATTARLDVAGNLEHDPSHGRLIQRMVKEMGLGDRVQLRGHVSDDDLAQLYRSSQVLVVPSLFEGFGIVYAEGMAFGLPAIAATEGARAVIEEGVNGFFVARDDIHALSERITRLHTDRELLRRMSLAAHARSRELSNWEETTDRIHDFLLTLV